MTGDKSPYLFGDCGRQLFEIRNPLPFDWIGSLFSPYSTGPIILGNHRKRQRTADPIKKAARKRQGATRAKNRKK